MTEAARVGPWSNLDFDYQERVNGQEVSENFTLTIAIATRSLSDQQLVRVAPTLHLHLHLLIYELMEIWMILKNLKTCCIGACALFLTAHASASVLTGDSVTLTLNNGGFGPQSYVVGAGVDTDIGNFHFDYDAGAGNEFLFTSTPNGGFLVEVQALRCRDSISLTARH
jgi:hypothetical protein